MRRRTVSDSFVHSHFFYHLSPQAENWNSKPKLKLGEEWIRLTQAITNLYDAALGHGRPGLESKPACTLLEEGHSVRGTVRSAGKGGCLKKLFQEYGDKLELAVVFDITTGGTSDEVAKGDIAIEHIASPFHMNAEAEMSLSLLFERHCAALGLFKSALKSGPVFRPLSFLRFLTGYPSGLQSSASSLHSLELPYSVPISKISPAFPRLTTTPPTGTRPSSPRVPADKF
ncbi:hypothetical protein HWV62_9581 [Athelia sp. TMB]|nr:hypothetical protein HWV62_9581 [Athelia sp. TMB]